MENTIPKIPDLALSHYRFILNNSKTSELHEEAKTKLFQAIDENSKYLFSIEDTTYDFIGILKRDESFFWLIWSLKVAAVLRGKERGWLFIKRPIDKWIDSDKEMASCFRGLAAQILYYVNEVRILDSIRYILTHWDPFWFNNFLRPIQFPF